MQRVTIVGAGTIGPPLALTFALHGFEVTLLARRLDALTPAQHDVERAHDELARADLLPAHAGGWRERLHYSADSATALTDAEIVMDAITEDLAAKRALFAEVEARVPASTLLTSTTSSIPVAELAAHLRHPQRFVVAHFANPPHLMPAVEVTPGIATSAETMERASAFVTRLGKEAACLTRDIPGQIFNRLQFALFREALALVRDGIATPAEIDRIVKHGYALRLPIEGPFEKADIASLPLMAAICRYIFPSLDNSTTPELLDQLIAQGRLGSKSGRGIYEWREGEASALIHERNAEVIRHLQRIKRVKTA